MRKTLEAGKAYCVKFYVNIANTSPYGMDGFGAYFGDASIDTISKCNVPLTYITPQVKNPPGNIITDTLNWLPITGTFVANGTEKYALLGNFLSDNAVTTASIGGAYYPQQWTDVCIDDVSCIDIDLPANAGPDRSIAPGDSAFIGRQPDVGIDGACQWYKLPAVITPTMPALDTVAGLYVKPVTTTTYVVRQQLWCSGVKWDTVVVYMNLTGLEKLQSADYRLKVWPNPVDEMLRIQIQGPGYRTQDTRLMTQDFTIDIINTMGQTIVSKAMRPEDERYELSCTELPAGFYMIRLTQQDKTFATRKLLVEH